MTSEINGNNVTWTQLTRELEHVQALADVRSRSDERALAVATEELHRRLESLNHAHREAVENWARTLPRETFSQFEREVLKWREEAVAYREKVGAELAHVKTTIEDRAKELQRESESRADGNRKLIAIVGIGVSLMAIVVPILIRVLIRVLAE